MRWAAHSIRSGVTKRSGGTGNSSVARSRCVGITPLTPATSHRRRLSHKHPHRHTFLLLQWRRAKNSVRQTGNGPPCLGQWHYERYADGCNPGSCCGALGERGQSSPHPLECRCSWVGLSVGMPSTSTALLNPASTNYRYSAVKGVATGGKDMGGENEKIDIK